MIKKLKIFIDILMYIDFVYLMSYGTIHKLVDHGIYGIVLFVLFIIHNLLNLSFYTRLKTGKYSSPRMFITCLNVVLFILMILMAISSVFMSGFIFSWATIATPVFARMLHIVSSTWGFFVMSLHLAIHVNFLFNKIGKSKNRILQYIVDFALIVCGVISFIKSNIAVYLFNTSPWKMSSPYIFVTVIEFVFITLGICAIYNLSKLILVRKNAKN